MKVSTYPCLIAALFAGIGCSRSEGPQTMRVWGDVSYDGRPVETGTIDFVSLDGSHLAQAPIKDGHYDLAADSGPVAEKTYRVEIHALAKTGKTVPNLMPGGDPAMELLAETIPAEYNAKSFLRGTISPEASKNQLDFNLAKGAALKR
jgi:hypothetical protein